MCCRSRLTQIIYVESLKYHPLLISWSFETSFKLFDNFEQGKLFHVRFMYENGCMDTSKARLVAQKSTLHSHLKQVNQNHLAIEMWSCCNMNNRSKFKQAAFVQHTPSARIEIEDLLISRFRYAQEVRSHLLRSPHFQRSNLKPG